MNVDDADEPVLDDERDGELGADFGVGVDVVFRLAHIVDEDGLALLRDATLQAATYQRDAAIEARPQALAALLPQFGTQASANRERAGFESGVVPSSVSPTGTIVSNITPNCVLSVSSDIEHCYSYVRSYGLTLTSDTQQTGPQSASSASAIAVRISRSAAMQHVDQRLTTNDGVHWVSSRKSGGASTDAPKSLKAKSIAV